MLDPTISYISIGCYFGGIEIIVPPGVNVVSKAISIFGGIENKNPGILDPNAPTVVVSGLVIFGGATIKVKPVKKKTSMRDVLSFFSKK